MKKNTLSKFDFFVFWFIIIDKLFFPYFWLKTVSYSFPFIFLWRVINLTHPLPYNRKVTIIVILAGLSTIFGCLMYPQYASDDVAIYLNFLSSLFSLQLFSYIKNRSNLLIYRKVYWILCLFILFVFAWTILYFIDYSLYDIVRQVFNHNRGESEVDVLSMSIRFGFFWSDVNNIGYMCSGLLLFIAMSDVIKLQIKCCLAFMILIIVFATMSTGAYLSCLISTFLFIYYVFIKDHRVPIETKMIILFMLLIICVVGTYYLIQTEVFEAAILRQEGKDDGGENSRLTIWKNFYEAVNFLEFIIIGHGGRTIMKGVFSSTHNGVLFLILSFGIVATWIYTLLYFLKPKGQPLKYWVWRIPVFLGFLVNIMITEEKIHVLMMLLLVFEYKSSSVVQHKK